MKKTIEVTKVSLPKGGGAIQGISESLYDNEFTGAASLSIPIPTSPCRGFEPHLSLTYSSGNGNGIFGLGFELSLPSIYRKTSQGLPQYTHLDALIFSDEGELVPYPKSNWRQEVRDKKIYQVIPYRPRIEESFSKIEQWVEVVSGESYWRVVDKNNVTDLFGKTAQGRVCDSQQPERIFQWLLQESFDAKGNHIIYEYGTEIRGQHPDGLCELNRSADTKKYIQKIKYGNTEPYDEGVTTAEQWLFEVVFDYGQYNLDSAGSSSYTPLPELPLSAYRHDPFSTYHAGFEIRTRLLCRNILMFHHFKEIGQDPALVHATRFRYADSPIATQLQMVEFVGFRDEKGSVQTKSLPPMELGYTDFQPCGHEFQCLSKEDDQPFPSMDSAHNFQFIDLYGEGIPGVLYRDEKTFLYWRPEGGKRGQPLSPAPHYTLAHQLATFPTLTRSERSEERWADLSGNGELELLVETEVGTGYYEIDADRHWKNFRSFSSRPVDLHHPAHDWVDVTGNGVADCVLIDQERVVVYPSLGKEGFASPHVQERTHDLPLARQGDMCEVVRFADMFGSGMQHRVRIRNGRVECWPNLGYGRFGKPILFDHPPHFDSDLDASRLFLADVDGSGTADILYVYEDRIDVFFNQSGNSFSDPLAIPLPSVCSRLSQIEFVDVFGNGTTCLVYSTESNPSQQWVYDFCQQQKPYLLNEVTNHLGAKTLVTYASSTKFYLADKQNGTPWITKLPFPVHVVEKIEHIDLISKTNLVSLYSYHHGYYDHVEREFQGFGRVERLDAEMLSESSEPTDMPPILTKHWYHTGAFLANGSLSRLFEKEYFQKDPDSYVMPDSLFDLSDYHQQDFLYTADGEAWRQACRAMKGSLLREEVYSPQADCMSPEQQVDAPYTVSEMNYFIRLLQPPDTHHYGVYFFHSREILSYDYERNPKDPAVQHELILEVDAYGHVLRDCIVHYGRRLHPDALPEQLAIKMTYNEEDYVHVIDSSCYLLGVFTQSKEYGIKNFTLSPEQKYVDFAQVDAHLKRVQDSAETPLLTHERAFYWSPEKQGACEFGQVTSQELLHHVEVVSFKAEEIANTCKEALSRSDLETLLKTAGGYFQEGDEWWNPGLSESYYGANTFYLPKATTDPFGSVTEYFYDSYCLLPVKVKDALNNEIQVLEIDYQTLQPSKILDSNHNTSEVLFDPLGHVIVSSHYGSEKGQDVGFMPLTQYQDREAVSVENLLRYPNRYLQGAASFFYDDLFCWMGRVHRKDIAALGVDVDQLFAELHERLYLSVGGGITQKCRKALREGSFQLSVSFASQQEEIAHFLETVSAGIPAQGVSLAASNYPEDSAPSILKIELMGLGLNVDDVWAELVAKKYIQPNGAVLEAFWDLQRADQMELSDAFASHRVAIFTILAGAVKVAVLYSDGFGRVLQAKKRVESGEAFCVADGQHTLSTDAPIPVLPVDLRWLASGETIYNNKGNPIKQYEPYFINTYRYIDNATLNRFGFSETLYYDPLGRVSKTETAKGFVTRKGWTPWSETHWDENDTLLDSPYYQANISHPDPASPYYDAELSPEEKEVLHKSSHLANTPEQIILDNLGLTIQQVALTEDKRQLITMHQYDIEGKLLSSSDPRLGKKGIKNFQYAYNRVGQAVRTETVDAGSSYLSLSNAMGMPIYGCDPRQTQVWLHYDLLHRLTTAEVQEAKNPKIVVERIIYGDSLEMAFSQNNNLRGNVYQHYDQSGFTELSSYNLLQIPFSMTQRMLQNYQQMVNWPEIAQADALLQSQTYHNAYQYDASGRLISRVDAAGNCYFWRYHVSNSLRQVLFQAAGEAGPQIVCRINGHNARGQRLDVDYGHQTQIKIQYAYDPKTFALTHLLATQAGGQVLQDLHYTYDPVGNVSHVKDSASVKLLIPDSIDIWNYEYTYDALYRLIRATGYESVDLNTHIPLSQGSKESLRPYTSLFGYDDSNNLYQLQHQSDGLEPVTTELTISPKSNRGVSTALTADPAKVEEFFDANGNQIRTKHLHPIHWNYHNHIQQVKPINSSVTDYYVYNKAGKRTRKVTEICGEDGAITAIEETHYLENLEIRRKYQGAKIDPDAIQEERFFARILDSQSLIATFICKNQGGADSGKMVQMRYSLKNVLSSCVLEVDEQGRVLSYEDYYPYGKSSIIASSSPSPDTLKHYHYSGKEKDNTTGLYYYGARFYDTDLERWLSPDPAGTIDGLNLYAFVRGNPATYRDLAGLSGKGQKREESPSQNGQEQERKWHRKRRRWEWSGQGNQGRGAKRSKQEAKPDDHRQYYYLTDQEKRTVRRMNSLARILHVHAGVVTAVGFSAFGNGIFISTNKKDQGIYYEIENRISILNSFLKDPTYTLSNALEGIRDSKHYYNSFSDKRLRKDLRKIRNSFQTKEHFPEEVLKALEKGNFITLPPKHENAHAERTIYDTVAGEFIGVTKLNCGFCRDFFYYKFIGGEIITYMLGTSNNYYNGYRINLENGTQINYEEYEKLLLRDKGPTNPSDSDSE